MHFDKIIHATQYYRAPTPLRDEWENDITNMSELSIDTFQIRINWRWNERVEGIYDFSDVDELFDIAERQGKKVIVKFLLECAPQYVFDKYGGTIIGPKGELIRGGSHGAFYSGWKPCFTNPDVRKRASLFVEEVTKRYRDRKSLILYNAWNEIRNKPVEECFCPHCRAAFGRYLKEKFGTIERLNSYYGAAEESFENIALPSMPHGYWDTFEFKKFQKKWFQTGHMKYSFFSLEHKTGGNLRAAIGGLSGVQKTNSSLRSEATVNMLRESPQTSEYLESQICERSWCRSIEREQALWRRC